MLSLDTPLVDVAWLDENLDNANVVVLDASVPPVVPGFEPVNSAGNFSCIPGARRFDYDKEICDPDSSLPHMMPSAEQFSEQVAALGVNADSLVVVYDDVGVYASPRAWWMFRAMGHRQVAVVDGGLRAWLEAGLPVSHSYEADVTKGSFSARPVRGAIVAANDVLGALDDPDTTIMDARSAARFSGQAPEPRKGLRSGHMPGATNLPFPEVLRDHRLKPADELAELFTRILPGQNTLLTSCGSGVTACILTLAAEVAGHRAHAVYDGSWSEWGEPGDLPVTLE